MIAYGLIPDYSKAVLKELAAIKGPATPSSEKGVVDLRDLLWCSLDNDDSLDLDQLTAAEPKENGIVKILIAIADVDAVVKKQSAIDLHAQQNTTSVYTVPEVFSMLPEKLSTDITSLNFNCDRLAMVIEIEITKDGSIVNSSVYRAIVRNKARLSYDSVAAWLDGTGPMPVEIAAVKGMEESLRLQDRIGQKMKKLRHLQGALVLETIEAKPVFSGDTLTNLVPDSRNRAKEIIEDFMIAANGVTARYLTEKKYPSIRRIVRSPKRWDRIVSLAAELGTVLPKDPDPVALENFLVSSQKANPVRFPDLSLSVIKLLGSGEYVVQIPDSKTEGHFGLAVKNYTHSTAPNRRYPDLITQRLLKAAISGVPSPYSVEELRSIAQRCNEAENAANKVERLLVKSAAAILLESRIGDQFNAIVTGAADKGTWVRILNPPLEGRLESGYKGLDVGSSLRVELVSTNVERGYIDFKRVN
jgi:exoribonuclease-2